METTIIGFRVMLGLLSRPSNVGSFLGLVWFFRLGFLLRLPKRYYIGGSR